MQVTTIQGVVESGQIKLAEAIEISERTIAYVVVPNIKFQPVPRVISPRIVDKGKPKDFERVIVEFTDDEI